ncbi:MAG: AbrB/MazE/SpoVT family DNA-binding domain-containing protein [Cumulibacter sp.]
MRTTMDKAGRIVIPAVIRERLGMTAGPVDIHIEGAGIRIDVEASDDLIEKDGRLIIPATGARLSSEHVRELRLADQR